MGDTSILTPAQQRAVGGIMDECNRCRPELDFLRGIGLPAEEEEQRVKHLQQIAEQALKLSGYTGFGK